MKYLAAALFIASIGVWGYNIGTLNPHVIGLDYSAVKQICDYAHTSNNPNDTEVCRITENATNSEYLCNSTGTSCWVESK
jgi:hypothetical protein